MENKDECIGLSIKSIITFALEIWRISNSLKDINEKNKIVSIKYSLRKLYQALETEEIEFIDLSQQNYDTGMAVDVIDMEGKKDENNGFVIEEMIEPIILLKEKVIHRGKVIIAAK